MKMCPFSPHSAAAYRRADIAGQLHGLGYVAPGQVVVTGSVLGKVMVQQYHFLFFMIWLGV